MDVCVVFVTLLVGIPFALLFTIAVLHLEELIAWFFGFLDSPERVMAAIAWGTVLVLGLVLWRVRRTVRDLRGMNDLWAQAEMDLMVEVAKQSLKLEQQSAELEQQSEELNKQGLYLEYLWELVPLEQHGRASETMLAIDRAFPDKKPRKSERSSRTGR